MEDLNNYYDINGVSPDAILSINQRVCSRLGLTSFTNLLEMNQRELLRRSANTGFSTLVLYRDQISQSSKQWKMRRTQLSSERLQQPQWQSSSARSHQQQTFRSLNLLFQQPTICMLQQSSRPLHWRLKHVYMGGAQSNHLKKDI
ncbi:hypothetical protein MBANPS3_004734 [Mucor bainieri]